MIKYKYFLKNIIIFLALIAPSSIIKLFLQWKLKVVLSTSFSPVLEFAIFSLVNNGEEFEECRDNILTAAF